MKHLPIAALAVAFGTATSVGAQEADSLRLEMLQEVVVQGVRASQNAPFAVTNVKKTQLDGFAKTGKELPFLFSQTPGVLAWSENGLGTGTTYMRIRGAAGSRVNVTLDGVPLNSPEDQCVFWANMNSYGTLLGSVQIQRGVGTSTNGDGAFGGTVAMTSKAPAEKAGGELSASYGSYNTFNLGGSFTTGLLWNHWVLDGAYHETQTDGYIHGTDGRSGSYYGGLSYVNDQWVVSYKHFGNFERTGQAWNGVTAGNDDMSIMDGTYGLTTGIKTYKDMWEKGLGRFNSLYERFIYNDVDDYATQRYRLADGGFWPKTTDNFWQGHNILSAAWRVNSRLSTSAALHYTHGHGYYEEFRHDNKLKKFGLSNMTDAEGATVKRSDFVRKKGLTQDVYGAVWSISYTGERLSLVGGLSAQQFSGNHYGFLTYASNPTVRTFLQTNTEGGGGKVNYRYYDSDADKLDASGYVKASFTLADGLSVFGDVQLRHVGYKTDGYNDKFVDNKDGTYGKHYLDIDEKYDFFNPKAGLSYTLGSHRVYASAAMSHREPERNNFTDNGKYPFPKAEQLLDYELGYTLSLPAVRLGLNLYYMDYKDQLVQTGEQSDIGENLTTNISKSYRMGVEVSAAWDVAPWLTLEGNAALSQNKIKDFDEFVEDWDDWEGNPDAALYHCDGNGDELRQFHYDNSTLAFSPSAILNGFVNLHHKGLQAVWHTNFVSRQYLDNTENVLRSLPCYSASDLNLNYTSKVKKAAGLKEVVVGLAFNNVFNRRYASSGWVYSAIAESYGHTPDNRYYQIGFIPMAGFTTMASLTLRF